MPQMVAPRILLCLALLLAATFSYAVDSTNTPPPATSPKSPADIEGSPEWVQRKLLDGDTDAIIGLGNKYAAGDGIPKDGKKAIALFTAAAVDSPRAECSVGLAFANGMGVSRDEIKAMDWYKAAAMDGYVPALAYLGRAYWAGTGGSPDYAMAFSCIRQGAACGYPPAQADLGFAYQEGMGTQPDLVESLKWLQLAENAGFNGAASKRVEVSALLDSSQKQEANRRVEAYKPITNYIPVLGYSEQVTVPLGNYFQIPVKILGKTNSLLVDTGSSCAFLDVGFRHRLGEPLASVQGNTASSSAATFGLYDCPEFFIGDRRFAPLVSIIEDIKNIQQASGESIQGVMGMNCLKYEVLCFDADHNSLSVGGSVPETVKKTALALPIEQHNSYTYGINVSINGQGPIFLAMDSGDAGCIDLNKTDWRTVFSGVTVKTRHGNSVDAGGKIVEDHSARLQSLTIGTNHYHNLITASLANSELPSRFGQEFIRRHVCYIDFPNRMLYLLPGQDVDRQDEYDMSGLQLLKIDGKVTVFSADEDAPGFQAGIRTNDQILSINGADAATLHLKSIRETLNDKPGNEIKMQVKHGDQTNSVTFRLKRLL